MSWPFKCVTLAQFHLAKQRFNVGHTLSPPGRIFLTTLNYLFVRASYASEHVNGGKFEETKKNVIREGKGGQPPSGGGNKKRLKSKKITTGKMHA